VNKKGWWIFSATAGLFLLPAGFAQTSPETGPGPILTATATLPPGDLPARLRQVFSDARFQGFQWSALVTALGSGKAIYEHNASEALVPASVVKLVTAAVALKKLGPEFLFRTEALQEGEDLWLRGGGDPSLVTERLYLLASDVRAAGVRKFRRLCADESAAPQPVLLEARKPEETDRAFNAPIGALNLNYNSVRVHLQPGSRPGGAVRVRIEPPNDFLRVEVGQLKTVKTSARWQLDIQRELKKSHDRIVIRGEAPAGAAEKIRYFNVSRPALYATSVLRGMLTREGIKITSKEPCLGLTPSDAAPLAQVDSFPLREIVVLMNKYSNNFISEALVRQLGRQTVGRASREDGLSALQAAMKSAGLWNDSARLVSPSGLDRENRLSAGMFVGLMRDLATDSGTLPEFLSSLPIAGRDGTLKDRVRGLSSMGTFRAKTGTLDGIGAMAGIAQAASGRIYVFAVMLNWPEPTNVDTRFWEIPFAQALIEGG
jgi:D-alanyl-D-alanine carboxypeptidase/D-alanyl-D-alanine-endopeptidase (penicillin-binding protein 4)